MGTGVTHLLCIQREKRGNLYNHLQHNLAIARGRRVAWEQAHTHTPYTKEYVQLWQQEIDVEMLMQIYFPATTSHSRYSYQKYSNRLREHLAPPAYMYVREFSCEKKKRLLHSPQVFYERKKSCNEDYRSTHCSCHSLRYGNRANHQLARHTNRRVRYRQYRLVVHISIRPLSICHHTHRTQSTHQYHATRGVVPPDPNRALPFVAFWILVGGTLRTIPRTARKSV